MPAPLYLAVDVGTGSARAALFTAAGRQLSAASHPIKTHHAKHDHYEQSTCDIWRAVQACVRLATARARPATAGQETFVAAIGIDATCSLVVVSDDADHTPLSVVDAASLPTDDVYNVILWLDRRAIAEAANINGLASPSVRRVRAHFGDTLSPENEPPKLLWLLRHKPSLIARGRFYDLADFLAFKCSADPAVRSACTVACKWGWGSDTDAAGKGVWTPAFWHALGLSALTANSFAKIGSRILQPGAPIGPLCEAAAAALGLSAQCIVAAPMIDAYCGSLWALGATSPLLTRLAPQPTMRLSVVCGTSTCFIQVSAASRPIKGVWGPFRDAMMPGMYVTEGGQSVTGKLLEHTVTTHPAYAGLVRRVGKDGVYDALAALTAGAVTSGDDPARHVHVLDYHAGNRSPVADAQLTGMVSGVTLGTDEWDLAVRFRATVVAICCGARHVVEALRDGGHDVRVVMAAGGLCRSAMFVRELAACVGLPVLKGGGESVLLGGSVLARCAAEGGEAGLVRWAREMGSEGKAEVVQSEGGELYERKYRVYREMHRDWVKYRGIMDGR